MEISLAAIVVIFLVGFVGSFISGMVGIGGAIINYPLLLYIPAFLGVAKFTAFEVSGITAIQVLFATIGGVWAYRRGGYLNKTIIGYMGTSILFGSFIGAFASSYMTDGTINIVYGLLAIIAVVMMLIPKSKEDEEVHFREEFFKKWLTGVLSLLVGIGAGIVGAGGSFILVPIMLTVLKLPTRMTIASSLAITMISAIGSTTGKLIAGQILLFPAAIVIIASLIAAPIGVRVGKKMNVKVLQWILAGLIFVTAVKIWTDILI